MADYEFQEFPKWLYRMSPTTADVPPVDPRMHGVTTTTIHDHTVQVDLVFQRGIVDTATVETALRAAGWVTDVKTAEQAAREAVRREQQRRANEDKDLLKQALREVLEESLLTDRRQSSNESTVKQKRVEAVIDFAKPVEPKSFETSTAQWVPAGRDRLPPLETEEQRRDAVEDKLARVRQDTDEPLPYDADFWKAAKEYQDRKTFRNWLKYGPDSPGTESAHQAFCRLLVLPSAEFVVARQQWRKKPKRGSQKKADTD